MNEITTLGNDENICISNTGYFITTDIEDSHKLNKIKVLVCFIGLTRTILETVENLRQNIFNENYSFTIVFVTWEGENVEDFINCFPEAIIYYIPTISFDDDHFFEWKKNSIMHSSWIGTYEKNDNALFHYYRQIFLWKQARIILEKYQYIDIFVRARTDVKLTGQLLNSYYEKVNSSNIFFPNNPRASFIGEIGCPDFIFVCKSSVFHYALTIVDSINYLYNKYNIPIQPETIMHFHILDKNIDLNYMDNEITIVRPIGFLKTVNDK